MNYTIKKPIKIVSTGHYVPKNRISSEQLEKELNIEKGWSDAHNGIQFRHKANEKESGAYMGAMALQVALQKADLEFEDLDLLIEASGSFDFPVAHNACLIPIELDKLDAGILCWDVDSTCLGFVTALDMVSYLLDGNRYKKVAIVNAEISTRSLNPYDKKTVTLFGDAATAVIVTLPEQDEACGILAADMKTYSEGAHLTIIKGGGNAIHGLTNPTLEDLTFDMKGKEVMKLAMKKVVPFTKKLLSQSNANLSDIHCVIPHQASKKALLFAQKALQLRDDQMLSIIAEYGNCISASIPLGLHTAIETGRLKRGEDVLLLGTAAGLSVGGIHLIY